MVILLDNWEKGRRVSQVEGRARAAAEQAEAEEVEFTLTLYADQISLNIPASPGGREFIARLTEILGAPRLEPTVKCSCSWGDGVMGAMYLVLWDLTPEKATQTLEDLHTFLEGSAGR
ncbi:MAG: hypothetical protein HY790_10455 [Deltaproteobacteria bacterium]|nr:hypothetical protein [Deltaproteobacteria bacterium]MBI4796235.1 hypothetical protein [Deltaproteobacteria bacterium]